MWKKIRTIILLSAVIVLALTAAANTCYAEKAVVVLYRSGCDYFIAQGNSGYFLLEWYGGYDPSEGDVIIGPIASYGFHDVFYSDFDNEGSVYVEDFWLGRSQALEEYIDHCE